MGSNFVENLAEDIQKEFPGLAGSQGQYISNPAHSILLMKKS